MSSLSHIPLRITLSAKIAESIGSSAMASGKDVVLDFTQQATVSDLLQVLAEQLSIPLEQISLESVRLGGEIPEGALLSALHLCRGEELVLVARGSSKAAVGGLPTASQTMSLRGEGAAAGRNIFVAPGEPVTVVVGQDPPHICDVFIYAESGTAAFQVWDEVAPPRFCVKALSGTVSAGGHAVALDDVHAARLGSAIQAGPASFRICEARQIGEANGMGLVAFGPAAREVPRIPKHQNVSLPAQPHEDFRNEWPWEAIIGPALMGVAFYFIASNKWYFALVLVSALIAVFSYFRRRRQSTKRHKLAVDRFIGQFTTVLDELSAIRDSELKIRLREVKPSEMERLVSSRNVGLWSRHPRDPDFLSIRLGATDLQVGVAIQRPVDLVLNDDQESRLSAASVMPDVPALIDLRRTNIGLVGPLDQVEALAEDTIARITALHSPRFVQLSVALPERGAATKAMFAFTRWLPHAQVAAEPMLVHATSRESAKVHQHIDEWLTVSSAPQGPERHHVYVVHEGCSLDWSDAATLRARFPESFHIVWVGSSRTALPSEVETVLEVDNGKLKRVAGVAEWSEARWGYQNLDEHHAYVLENARRQRQGTGIFDIQARALSPLYDHTERLESDAIAASIPLDQLVDGWLDGIATNPSTTRTLELLLGVDADGPFSLDLASEGPHLLVGGTTNSGKSELLQTLAAGLVRRYPPSELSLALVDFKGGATFRPFADLPHTAAYISNLDSGNIQRVLDFVAAEIRGRQITFEQAEADGAEFENYQAFREACSNVVLPRLVVMLDEFATLADEHPKALDAALKVAAQGRAYGVHLILATQRPSTAVRGNILANVGARVSLRTLSVDESKAIIETADSASIPTTLPGRAIIRLAGGSLRVFQAGHATYRDVPTSLQSVSVRAFTMGMPIWPISAGEQSRGRMTALRRCLMAVKPDLARGMAPLAPHPSEAAPPEVELDASRPSRVHLGSIDLPGADLAAERTQPHHVDLRQGGILVTGGSGSGKTTTLLTILSQLRSLNPYCIAIGLEVGSGEMLKLAASGVIDWAPVDGEDDGLDLLIEQLQHEVLDRQNNPNLAHVPIVVVFDDLDFIAELRDNAYDASRQAALSSIGQLLRRGRHVGVYALGSARALQRLDPRVKTAFTQRLQLTTAELEDDLTNKTALGLPLGIGVLPTGSLLKLARAQAPPSRQGGASFALGPLPSVVYAHNFPPLHNRLTIGFRRSPFSILSVPLDEIDNFVICGDAGRGREIAAKWIATQLQAASASHPLAHFGESLQGFYQDLVNQEDIICLPFPYTGETRDDYAPGLADIAKRSVRVLIDLSLERRLPESERVVRNEALRDRIQYGEMSVVAFGSWYQLQQTTWLSAAGRSGHLLNLDTDVDSRTQAARNFGAQAVELPRSSPPLRGVYYAPEAPGQIVQLPTLDVV